MRLLTALFIFLLGDPSFANGGSSVPWPWPWAHECPIDFETLNGTYVVRESPVVDFIQINTHWDSVKSLRYLEIRLYNQDFDLLLKGETYTEQWVRSIYVPMEPKGELRLHSLQLRIYHRSQRRSCESKELIPILTVQDSKGDAPGNSEQMILEPMSNWDEESP